MQVKVSETFTGMPNDVNTEGTKPIVPKYTSSKKTKKRFKMNINNSVLKYFRNCAVETQR
jgi:hypothetical protein